MGKKTKRRNKILRTIFMILLACLSFMVGFSMSDKLQTRELSKRKADIPYIRIKPQKRPDYKDGIPIIFYSEEVMSIRMCL